jgi:hypothetical protein
MTGRKRSFISLFVVLALVMASLTMAGCGSKNEQDNCYGEDMPVINK